MHDIRDRILQIIGVAAAVAFGTFTILAWQDARQATQQSIQANIQSNQANTFAFAAFCAQVPPDNDASSLDHSHLLSDNARLTMRVDHAISLSTVPFCERLCHGCRGVVVWDRQLLPTTLNNNNDQYNIFSIYQNFI